PSRSSPSGSPKPWTMRWNSQRWSAPSRTTARSRGPTATKGSPMKIRPLHDRVIVKRLDEEKKTASGIVIPDTAAEKPDQGEVMSVGKGKLTDEGELV